MEIKLLTIINKKEFVNLTPLELVGDYYVSIDKNNPIKIPNMEGVDIMLKKQYDMYYDNIIIDQTVYDWLVEVLNINNYDKYITKKYNKTIFCSSSDKKYIVDNIDKFNEDETINLKDSYIIYRNDQKLNIFVSLDIYKNYCEKMGQPELTILNNGHISDKKFNLICHYILKKIYGLIFLSCDIQIRLYKSLL